MDWGQKTSRTWLWPNFAEGVFATRSLWLSRMGNTLSIYLTTPIASAVECPRPLLPNGELSKLHDRVANPLPCELWRPAIEDGEAGAPPGSP
jgi:hypothetical protein